MHVLLPHLVGLQHYKAAASCHDLTFPLAKNRARAALTEVNTSEVSLPVAYKLAYHVYNVYVSILRQVTKVSKHT